MDVSILIVHYNTPGLLRQTLRAIERANPSCSYEVIVVDNNPKQRISKVLKEEFSRVVFLESASNQGFGRGMNQAIEQAQGDYLFVYNPDIMLQEGVLERLLDYMKQHPDVGMVGPKLLNPNGTHQNSCYRFMTPEVILYRRIPGLGRLGFARKSIDHYLMTDLDRSCETDVDYILGAAMFVRRVALEEVGGFDPGFFMYFEDQDLCRRFWQAGWRVVYYPHVSLIHYHRRETAEGSFIRQLLNPLTRIQMKSALYYYRKYRDDYDARS